MATSGQLYWPPVGKISWPLTLARNDDTVVFGQREGRVGLGTVVELGLSEGTFRARRSGGWELQMPDASERVEACFTASVDGTAVTSTG